MISESWIKFALGVLIIALPLWLGFRVGYKEGRRDEADRLHNAKVEASRDAVD